MELAVFGPFPSQVNLLAGLSNLAISISMTPGGFLK